MIFQHHSHAQVKAIHCPVTPLTRRKREERQFKLDRMTSEETLMGLCFLLLFLGPGREKSGTQFLEFGFPRKIMEGFL